MFDTTPTTETASTISKVLYNIQGIGRTWASYGLNAGKNALEQSAGTLKNSAEFLGTLASKFGPANSDAESAEVAKVVDAVEEPPAEASTKS